MSREYFCAYHSYLEGASALDDAALGRLFRACLEYSSTGKIPDIEGEERILFPSWKSQIDRDNLKYDARCQKNRENSEIRWHANAYERMQTDAKDAKAKGKAKEKEILPPISPQGDSEGFAEFWSAYPRKTGKGAARNAWGKIRPTRELQERILQAIEQAKLSDQWQRDGGQYIPNPATWLNQERWEDGEDTPPAPTPSPRIVIPQGVPLEEIDWPALYHDRPRDFKPGDRWEDLVE